MAGHLPGHRFESLPELFFLVFISHLSLILNDRSDCQMWSINWACTASCSPHLHTHMHKHTQCVHPCAYPTVFVPYSIIGVKLCTPSPPMVLQATQDSFVCALTQASVLLLLTHMRALMINIAPCTCYPRNTLFTQPCPMIMKYLPSNLW